MAGSDGAEDEVGSYRLNLPPRVGGDISGGAVRGIETGGFERGDAHLRLLWQNRDNADRSAQKTNSPRCEAASP